MRSLPLNVGRSQLADRVRRTIDRFELLPPGSRAIVALSGGADSVALLAILRELASTGAFSLVGVAHLNHQLRGSLSDEDEAFCVKLAAGWCLPIRTDRVDVLALARAERRSLEDAARLARYRFLEQAARDLAADRIAVGHTRDDQAETLLLRLVRGAGPRGLAGIFPRAGRVVRPLIETRHDEILEYLKAARIDFRHDTSNDDLRFARNRIRHELLPILKQKYSGRIVEHLAQAAEILRTDAELLDALAAGAYERVVRTSGATLEIEVDDLASEPSALQRRLILMGLKAIAPNRFSGFDQVRRILSLAGRGEPGPVDLPGVCAQRHGRTIRLRPAAAGTRVRHAEEVGFRYQLAVPGEVAVPEAGCAITAEAGAAIALTSMTLRREGDIAVVAADDLDRSLVVRSRRPGDRFRPLGLAGHKKLQDLFVDHKIARTHRDRVPIVVDKKDRIVWVAGVAVSEDFRVTSRTRDVVILKLRRWSETG